MDLKEGDIISLYGEECVVKKVETSGEGIKKGRSKCRVEVEGIKDKQQKVIIKLAEDTIEVK